MNKFKIIIASDHAGYDLKENLINFFQREKIDFLDLGVKNHDSVNYVDYGKKLALKVLDNSNNKKTIGIGICGTGIGISMSLNRFKGIRAALCRNINDAELSRKHNDANVLVLGGRTTQYDIAIKITQTFLSTDFESGRHLSRIKSLDE